MVVLTVQRWDQYGDPSKGHAPETLKPKSRKTCLKKFPYQIYRYSILADDEFHCGICEYKI